MSGSRAPWLSTATALFFTWSALAFFVRVWVKLRRSENWGLDDSTILAAFAVALFHVAATFWAVHYGYGLPLASIPELHKDQVEKALYASQFFYVVSVGLSKVSTGFFIGRLTRYGPQVRLAYVLTTVSGVWTIASIFAVAFRGNLVHPWATLDGSEAMYVRWIGVEVIGLVIEVALWALTIKLIWGLNMALRKRVLILGAFGCRLVLIPIVAIRLFCLSPSENSDPTATSIIANILTEAALELCLISACITSLKPFLQPIHSGYIVNSVGAPGSGLRSGIRAKSQDSYYMLSAAKGADNDGTLVSLNELPQAKAAGGADGDRKLRNDVSTALAAGRGGRGERETRMPRISLGRQSLDSDERPMVITRTRTFMVSAVKM